MATSSIITSGSIRQRFADTSLPADPTDTIELPGSRHWPDSLRKQLTGTLTPAGILIPIYDRPDTGLSVLLTQRSAELKHHAGQISFPGGRMEPEDSDIAVTALRETEEEVGISSADRRLHIFKEIAQRWRIALQGCCAGKDSPNVLITLIQYRSGGGQRRLGLHFCVETAVMPVGKSKPLRNKKMEIA